MIFHWTGISTVPSADNVLNDLLDVLGGSLPAPRCGYLTRYELGTLRPRRVVKTGTGAATVGYIELENYAVLRARVVSGNIMLNEMIAFNWNLLTGTALNDWSWNGSSNWSNTIMTPPWTNITHELRVCYTSDALLITFGNGASYEHTWRIWQLPPNRLHDGVTTSRLLLVASDGVQAHRLCQMGSSSKLIATALTAVVEDHFTSPYYDAAGVSVEYVQPIIVKLANLELFSPSTVKGCCGARHGRLPDETVTIDGDTYAFSARGIPVGAFYGAWRESVALPVKVM